MSIHRLVILQTMYGQKKMQLDICDRIVKGAYSVKIYQQCWLALWVVIFSQCLVEVIVFQQEVRESINTQMCVYLPVSIYLTITSLVFGNRKIILMTLSCMSSYSCMTAFPKTAVYMHVLLCFALFFNFVGKSHSK